MKKSVKIIALAVCLILACTAVLAGCGEKKETLDKDTTFYVVPAGFKINFIKLSDSAWELLTPLLFDLNNSYIKLKKDGTIELNLKVNEAISSAMKFLSSIGFDVDLSAISEMDLKGMADIYAAAILPGFTLEEGKVRESVELLRSLGAELVLDYEDEEVKKLIKSLEETGHANKDFQIPAQIGVRYEGEYEVRHATTFDGKEKTIIFVDEYGVNGEPYLQFELTTDAETNLRSVHLRVDFLELDLTATEK